MRTEFEFIANENLKGVLATEVSSNKWGASGVYDLGQTPVAIGVRRAYVDFNWPGTKVNIKAGPLIGVSLPAAIGGGSAILDEEISSLVVSAPITDNVSILGVYGRAFSGSAGFAIGGALNTGSYMDAFALAVPLKFDGVKVTPFGMYSYAGQNVNAANTILGRTSIGLLAQNASLATGGLQAWWGGAAIEVSMFDPFVFKADVNYGSAKLPKNGSGLGAGSMNQRSGWLADLSIAYTGLSFMTPELFFSWTSGEEGNSTTKDGSSKRMPMLVASNWALGSFFFGGSSLLGGDLISPAREGLATQLGFWALGLNLKDITFLEGLKHTFTVMYVQGTNNRDIGLASTAYANTAVGGNSQQIRGSGVVLGRTLTTKDSLWEVDLNTKYQIYKELTAYLELGYIAPSISKSVWGDSIKSMEATKVAVGVGYTF